MMQAFVPARTRIGRALVPLALALLVGPLPAQDKAAPAGKEPERTPVETVEKLGAIIPEDLEFYTVDRKKVNLRSLIDKPTILNLVYITCPNICSPLMQELARMVDQVKMEPGKEYQVLTVSFDHREHLPEKNGVVRNAEKALYKLVKREMPAGSWRVLTGPKETIKRLTDAVGFYFWQRPDGDYDHPAATIFVSKEGKVTRYLHGVELLAANVELALVDTMAGRERSAMRKVQQLCFSFDKDRGTYVLRVNRIILAVSVVAVIIFLFLLLRVRKRKAKPAEGGES